MAKKPKKVNGPYLVFVERNRDGDGYFGRVRGQNQITAYATGTYETQAEALAAAEEWVAEQKS